MKFDYLPLKFDHFSLKFDCFRLKFDYFCCDKQLVYVRLLSTFTEPEVNPGEFPILSCCQGHDHARDTVFNVCLTVGKHLEEITDKIANLDGSQSVLLAPTKISGDLTVSVVKSCCGNVIHTLLDKDEEESSGAFLLPGFEAAASDYDRRRFGAPWNDNSLRTTHMDHVTYVCHQGESKKILSWYNTVFKMERFLVGPQVF